jgi:hypothetical protein
MKRWIALLSLVLAAAAGTGCAKTGSVQEKTPLTADLATYKSASIEVDIPSDVKNADTTKTQFASQLGDKLREKKIFAEVSAGGGDMTLRVKVTKVESGNKGLQAMSAGGDSEVSASVELFDTKQNKVVGAFDVTGNSKKNVNTSVGGVNTKAMEDTTGAALGAAGDEIVAYLDKHRGGGAK